MRKACKGSRGLTHGRVAAEGLDSFLHIAGVWCLRRRPHHIHIAGFSSYVLLGTAIWHPKPRM